MKLNFIIICNLILSAWNTLLPESLLPSSTSLPRNFYLFFKTLTQISPPLSLSILRSNFPLSLPPLLPSPSLGLYLPGTQMPSSRVICFAKILFRFDKLWAGQLIQHDSARENSEAACPACRLSELRQDGRHRNLSLTDGSTRLSLQA